MARNAKPWLRASNKTWYVWHRGKQVSLGTNKTKAMAKWHRMALQRPTKSCTVEDLIKRYWRWLKNERSEETVSRRKPILKSFLDFLQTSEKKKQASELSPALVQEWANTWKNPTTRGDRIGLIKSICNWGIEYDYLEVNPVAKLKRPAANIRQDFIPADLWQKVLDLATDQVFREWLLTMISTGCRVTEMFKLEARYFDNGRFTLPITLSKGRKKSRVIYIPNEVLPTIQRLLKENPEGPIFLNKNRKPWNRNSIRCRFRRFKKELEMPDLTATTLRHSFAHWRLTNGQDSLTVAKLLGHASTEMLAKRYGHLEQNPDYMKSAANLISLPIPNITPPPTSVE